MRSVLFLSVFLLGSCSRPGASSPPRPGCNVANHGPVIGYTYRNVPPAPSTAGQVANGTYDLVEVVRHTPEKGPWTSDMAPAFRWAMQFKTTETSSNHASGIVHSAAEIPPSVACGNSRFATFQNELRFQGGVKGIESVAYTAQGDMLTITKADGDGGSPVTYVFRRR
jgi:hypothetical protein